MPTNTSDDEMVYYAHFNLKDIMFMCHIFVSALSLGCPCTSPAALGTPFQRLSTPFQLPL